ncbi:MAG TPA: 3-hydroxyacyl-ACP dehydratase FabZ [Candidatus Handelsmanbacteria bacterium]|nr:3-hydroxyacyl-ACP dehydratase FabZ [Candidatus Handelsmanbacteria bacterium]
MTLEGVVLNAAGICRTIPHRAPFLLVDRILELVPEERILGALDIRAEAPWLAGHFPAYAVMPGVLIIEALAQTAAVLMMHEKSLPDRFPFFAGIDRARFRTPVVPGDTLHLDLTVAQQRPDSCKLHGMARVGDKTAAEAEIFAVLRATG